MCNNYETAYYSKKDTSKLDILHECLKNKEMEKVSEEKVGYSALSEDDKAYIGEMKSWFIEQTAREKEMKTIVETATTIAEQNRIQLGWHYERMGRITKEFEEWCASKGLDPAKVL